MAIGHLLGQTLPRSADKTHKPERVSDRYRIPVSSTNVG